MFKEFAADEVIFREGDPANRFYLVLDGEARLRVPDAIVLLCSCKPWGATTFLDGSWIFPPFYWHFDARATEPTKAIFFYGRWLREKTANAIMTSATR